MAVVKLDLPEWDARIAPRLDAIEVHGNGLGRYAQIIQEQVSYLHARPAWQSRARAVLNTAEIELRQALALIQETQREYDNLPVCV